MLGFLRKNPRRGAIDTLYERIAVASRQAQLYLALDVPDTLEGRFESLVLHALLVLRRLRRLPSPADEVAQDLVDALFEQLDRSLRELGVGDFGVPKRMKKLAQAVYDRGGRYDPALDAADETALAEALGRNLFDGARPAQALARYAIAAEAELAALDLDALFRQGPRFPSPERFAEGGTR
jgi:cytochrome b pre-mRNA-processing protein 3